MTEVTEVEIQRIFVQLVFMGILAVFVVLYASAPISGYASGTLTTTSAGDVSGGSTGWLSGITSTLEDSFPGGLAALIIVSSIILIPMTVMNAFTVLRIVKDLATQWL